jgi:type IV pilus assembly protein PilX
MIGPRPVASALPRPTARPQSGIALVIGLVLLALLTILGIAGMQAAAIELQMAANEQARQRAFEAAEAGIEQALAAATFSVDPGAAAALYDDPAAVEPVPVPGQGTPIDGCAGDPGRPDAHCEYFVRFDQAAGAVLMPGMDPAAGLRAYYFVVDSSGVSDRGARSDHVQAFYVVGPAGLLQECNGGLGSCALSPATTPVRTTWRQRGAG